MFDLIRQVLPTLHRATGIDGRLGSKKNVLLFDSENAAEDIALMLNARWDGCNGVVLSSVDEVAVNVAAKLVEALWCYEGATEALLIKFTAGELMRRYAAGERFFINSNLRCEDLSERDINNVNLSYAKLKKANFSKTNLNRADLTRAEINEANLSNANLSHASLARASLNKANLSLANFTGAFLERADLREANLTDANFSKAILDLADLRGATLTNINLSGASLKGTLLTSVIP